MLKSDSAERYSSASGCTLEKCYSTVAVPGNVVAKPPRRLRKGFEPLYEWSLHTVKNTTGLFQKVCRIEVTP